ncbi:mitofilin family membrane protein [Rhodobacteraceae bacterium KMM 6894]|nr:mitofilin family membrane protein [Rhodobacteraceae bacterium KMM 6894]
MAGKKTTAGRHGLPTKGQAATDAQPDPEAKSDTSPAAPLGQTDAETPKKNARAASGKSGVTAQDSKKEAPATTSGKASDTPQAKHPEKKDAGDTPKPDQDKPSDTTQLPVVTQTEQRSGGTLAALMGGVLAAGIGLGAAYWILPQLNLLEHPQDMSALDGRISAGEDDIQALTQRLDNLPVLDTAAMEDRHAQMQARMTDLSEQTDGLTEQLADLDSRLNTLESRPAGTGGSVSSGEIAALQEALTTQADQIAGLQTKLNADETARAAAAQAAATATLRRAALSQIRTAVDTGAEFAPALADLEQTGLTAPDALYAAAEGVPTLASLQDTFAPAARAALAAARAGGEKGDEGGSKFWSFMGDQLGARSLEPREGPGTDATLSRAEAALRAARLEDALAEIDTLSDPARAQMSDWAATARSRLEATQALDALSAELN